MVHLPRLSSISSFFHKPEPVDSDPHVYIAPKPTDSRSPCPALNTMANHGYIPRNGRHLTPHTLAPALRACYGLSDPLATFLAYGGWALLKTILPLSLKDIGRYGCVEHNASVVHRRCPTDAGVDYGCDTIDPDLAQAFLDVVKEERRRTVEGREGEEGYLTVDGIAKIRVKREGEEPIDAVHQEIARGEVALVLQIFGEVCPHLHRQWTLEQSEGGDDEEDSEEEIEAQDVSPGETIEAALAREVPIHQSSIASSASVSSASSPASTTSSRFTTLSSAPSSLVDSSIASSSTSITTITQSPSGSPTTSKFASTSRSNPSKMKQMSGLDVALHGGVPLSTLRTWWTEERLPEGWKPQREVGLMDTVEVSKAIRGKYDEILKTAKREAKQKEAEGKAKLKEKPAVAVPRSVDAAAA